MPFEQPRANQPRHAITLFEDGFEVRYRNQVYGLFRIQWALDLRGHELIYQGQMVASIGISCSVFADFEGSALPPRVRQAAIIAFAAVYESIRIGNGRCDQPTVIENTLADHGLERFAVLVASTS